MNVTSLRFVRRAVNSLVFSFLICMGLMLFTVPAQSQKTTKNPDGTYAVDRVLTGIKAGSFAIDGTVTWKDVYTSPQTGAPLDKDAGAPLISIGVGSGSPFDKRKQGADRLNQIGRAMNANRMKYEAAWSAGLPTADRSKVKAFEQARKSDTDALKRLFPAALSYMRMPTDSNDSVISDLDAKVRDANRIYVATESAVIDSMTPDKRAEVTTNRDALNKTSAEYAGAAQEYIRLLF